MRDSLRVVGVLLVLGALTLIARSWHERGWAAATPVPAAKLKTKVALINLSDVIKKYDKFKTFQKELKAAVVPFQAKDAAFKAEANKLVTEAKDNNTTAARRLEIEDRVAELKKAIEVNKTAANTELKKRQEEQLRILYKDVEAASRRYAIDHDIELVLHYNDAVTEKDLWDPRNVARKMQAGALMPIYAAPGIDVSKEITAALNDALRRKKGG